MDARRLKTTGEVVYALSGNATHTNCLFLFNRISKKGHRGHTQPVRNDKLVSIRMGYTYGEVK